MCGPDPVCLGFGVLEAGNGSLKVELRRGPSRLASSPNIYILKRVYVSCSSCLWSEDM